MRKRTFYEFVQVCEGAYNVWTGGDLLGTLLRQHGHWEAYDDVGEQVLTEDNRPAVFRSRDEAAETLDTFRRE